MADTRTDAKRTWTKCFARCLKNLNRMGNNGEKAQ